MPGYKMKPSYGMGGSKKKKMGMGGSKKMSYGHGGSYGSKKMMGHGGGMYMGSKKKMTHGGMAMPKDVMAMNQAKQGKQMKGAMKLFNALAKKLGKKVS